MINFSTEFPIDAKNSVAEVIRLACKWVAGSPHTNIKKSAFSNIEDESDFHLAVADEQIAIHQYTQSKFSIGGFRYTKTENNKLIWTTSIVTHKSESRHVLSIQVTCDALNTAAKLPLPKKPIFLTQAIAELGGGMDGQVPVTDKPIMLNEEDVAIAAALITGVGRNSLPIVYVSADYSDGHMLEPKALARYLSGSAHVIVEPSRIFSSALKPLVGSRNVYGGTVGVYWPSSTARKAYYQSSNIPDPTALQEEISKDIRKALSNRRLSGDCTWAHLQEVRSRHRIDQLKAEGSTEVEKYIEEFGSELNAKDALIFEKEQEISRLNAELSKLLSAGQQHGNRDDNGILKPGAEQELYMNEISDIVIYALRDSLRTIGENSRRYHIINDILLANEPTGIRDKMDSDIKTLLKTYREMDKRTRGLLTKMGFSITEEGKHHKMVYQNDQRYTFILPKTGSDHRGGKNLASDITSKLL